MTRHGPSSMALSSCLHLSSHNAIRSWCWCGVLCCMVQSKPSTEKVAGNDNITPCLLDSASIASHFPLMNSLVSVLELIPTARLFLVSLVLGWQHRDNFGMLTKREAKNTQGRRWTEKVSFFFRNRISFTPWGDGIANKNPKLKLLGLSAKDSLGFALAKWCKGRAIAKPKHWFHNRMLVHLLLSETSADSVMQWHVVKCVCGNWKDSCMLFMGSLQTTHHSQFSSLSFHDLRFVVCGSNEHWQD